MRKEEQIWEDMLKHLDREYKAEWVKLVVCIIIITASFGIVFWIWNSDLPTWLKLLLTC